MSNQQNNRKRFQLAAYIVSMLVAVVLAAASFILYQTVTGLNIIPERYTKILLFALIGFNAFFALVAFIPKVNTLNRILQILFCGAMAAAMMFVNAQIPNYLGQFQRMFNAVPEEGTLLMSVYAMSDSENVQTVQDLPEAKIGVLNGKDAEYLDYSSKVISRELNGGTITTTAYDDLYAMVEDFYSGKLDAVLMNQTYAGFIADNADFQGFNYKTKIIYTIEHKIKLEYEENAVGSITTEPFVIAITGNDSWSYSNITKPNTITRSDVNMLVVIHPVTKKVLVVSIPRDTYIAIGGDSSKMDKLTHATIEGIDAWKKSLNDLLDCDINYFVRVNFQSLVNVVNSVGGIDIDNPYAFTTSGTHPDYTEDNKALKWKKFSFPQGTIHLNGAEALAYVRERKGLKGGDLDRNKHQVIVIKGLIDKVTSVKIITKITDLLNAVNGSFVTDLKTDQIFGLVQMQLNDMASWNLDSYAVTGTGAMRTSYEMGAGTTEKQVTEKVAKVNEDGTPVLDENGEQVYETVTKTVIQEANKYSVIIASEASLKEAKAKIRDLLSGQ